MAAHAKFLFDVPLDGNHRGRSRAEEDAARQVEAAREKAFADGVAEGRRQQAGESEDALARLASEIVQNSAAVLARLDSERERLAREAAGLAFAAANALAPTLIARAPHAELDALFAECIANLANAPHLVIRVPEGAVAALRERLEQSAHGAGYDGRIVVLQDDDMAAGDCSIEWADGGLTRSFADMTALVRQSVERRYGALETGAPETLPEPAPETEPEPAAETEAAPEQQASETPVAGDGDTEQ